MTDNRETYFSPDSRLLTWSDRAKAYCMIVTMGTLALSPPPVEAMNNADVDEMNGTLFITGALTESACRLEMSSVRQEVLLGEVGTGRLQFVGAKGNPVRIDLRLEDCLKSNVASRDMSTGTLSWASEQPVMSMSFSAVRDEDNPTLVKAQGVSGMGLRLEDVQGRKVHLGSRGSPLLLQPGQNTLSFTVIPERTRAVLVAGSYQARVNIHLTYD